MGKTNENEIKQLKTEELTMFQQIAVEAEVMSIMQECDEQDEYEKRYYAFLKLALCEEKYLLVYKHEFMKYLEESVLNELVGYRHTEIVPTYLFAKKYAKELKAMVGEDCGSLRIFKQPTKIIQSRFIVAMRELLNYIPATTSAVLDAIISESDGEFNFLLPIIFTLKQEAENFELEQKVGFDVKLKLLSTPINRAPIMNIQIEDEHLMKKIKNDSMTKEERTMQVAKDLSSVLNHMINLFTPIEVEEVQQNEEEVQEKLVYVVKKIDKSNNQVVFTKEFDTQQQAADYIKGIVRDYPEIAKRFNFAVELCEVD